MSDLQDDSMDVLIFRYIPFAIYIWIHAMTGLTYCSQRQLNNELKLDEMLTPLSVISDIRFALGIHHHFSRERLQFNRIR